MSTIIEDSLAQRINSSAWSRFTSSLLQSIRIACSFTVSLVSESECSTQLPTIIPY